MICATMANTENCAKNTDISVSRNRAKNRVKSVVQRYIAENFRGMRHGAYHLANAAGFVSIRTAECWLAGRSWPQNDDLMELCITCEKLQTQLHDLAATIRAERESK